LRCACYTKASRGVLVREKKSILINQVTLKAYFTRRGNLLPVCLWNLEQAGKKGRVPRI